MERKIKAFEKKGIEFHYPDKRPTAITTPGTLDKKTSKEAEVFMREIWEERPNTSSTMECFTKAEKAKK